MRKAEIVIIGGGVIGASVAYHLRQRGARDVLILEREAEQGRGSTGKATGGVRAQFETQINIRMSLYSIDFFQNCEFDCGYEPAGYLFLATDESQMEFLRSSVATQRSLGYDEVEIVDNESIGRMVPGLNCEDLVGGSYGPRDGFIDPIAVMKGFTQAATKRGAAIEFEAEVLRINVNRERVVSISTNRGDIGCEMVVLCAGAWSSRLAATAGIDLPVEPLRRQLVWAKTAMPLPADLPMVIELGSGFHFRPVRESEVKLSSTTSASLPCRDVLLAYPDPDEKTSYSTEFDDGFIDKIFERVRTRASFLSDSKVIIERCRAGLYENTPDRHAILGGCEVKGLYFASGFSGHGVMHSPAAGRALSEIILDGEAGFMEVSCLNIARFSSGELLHETSFI